MRRFGKKGLDEEALKEMQETAKRLASKYKKLNIMNAIEGIVALAEDSQFCPEFFELADRYLAFLSEKQGITKEQALMLALFVELNTTSNQPDTADLKRFVNCNGVQILIYQADLAELSKQGLLNCSVGCTGDDIYRIPDGMMKAFLMNEPFKRVSYAGLTPQQVFKKIHVQTHRRAQRELTTELMVIEVERILSENENLHYVQEIDKLEGAPIDRVLISHFCSTIVVNHRDCLELREFAFLFDDHEERINFIEELEKKTHHLIINKVLEPAFDNGYEDKSKYRLTDKMRDKLLKGVEYTIDLANNTSLTPSKKIVKKKLFFDAEVNEQMVRLTHLVDEKNYKEICKRLKKKGLRKGFACLFYGPAGTGKTESVLQLARESGRDIMQVNISEVKSKWVGESEKNIKAIFDCYRMAVKSSKVVPILLFNEADAILSKRSSNIDQAVDKMENSIQNIILQEMETMEGIMIATTNLEKNMDSAFERRFLFKVKFKKPSSEQRRHIWQTMMPTLQNDTADYLASHFDFSGGQIENIARKANIDSVLYGQDTIDQAKLEQFCKEETLEKKTTTRKRIIGFTAC